MIPAWITGNAARKLLLDEAEARISELERERDQLLTRLAEALAALEPVAALADEIEQCAQETGHPVEGWATSLGWENVSRLRDIYRALAGTAPTTEKQP